MPSSYAIVSHFERLIKQKVESGRYNSASEVVRDALRLFEEHEELRETQIKNIRLQLQENAIRLIEPQFTSMGIKIDKHFHDFESLQSIGFPNEFMQVILNLFSNSRDAILQRRKIDGQPEVGCITINISVHESDRIIIHIKDNGCGIPARLNARIFDPYFTTKEEGEGTGIGLYMSRVIVENHLDGRISIAESLDGAVFIIELPLRKNHDPS